MAWLVTFTRSLFLLSKPGFGLELFGGAQHSSVVLGSCFWFVFVLFVTVKVLFCALNKIKKKNLKKMIVLFASVVDQLWLKL